jgi:hypothetical protein
MSVNMSTASMPAPSLMSPYEEDVLYHKLTDYRQLTTSKRSKELNRLYRKLSVRRMQRKSGGKNCFNLAKDAQRLGMMTDTGDGGSRLEDDEVVAKPVGNGGGVRALDRYQRCGTASSSSPVGIVESEQVVQASILSPYTGRCLKPYIRRDGEMRPLRLRLFDELRCKKSMVGQRHPIDFCYIRPQLVPPVNQLARHFFWPCIDGELCSFF